MASALGIDVSESMLQQCQETHPKVEVICADLTRSDPVPERMFDLVTAFRFFPNAEDQLRVDAMLALSRKVKPNGVLIFNNHKHAGNIVYRARNVLGRPNRAMTHSQALSLVSMAGLKVEEIRGFGILPSDERWMAFPGFIHRVADATAAWLGVDMQFGQDLVYVCRKAG